MSGPFTLPDPLRADANPKTLSIYVTELQVCVNQKRIEISQVPLTFIVQAVGRTMRLDAIEELKTRTNQLALDFGFTGGVTNVDLLGRSYVDHPKINNEPVTGFPIINDLRRVLEALEVLAGTPQFVSTTWYTDVAFLGTLRPLANWTISSNPWETIPLDVQTGLGGTCPEGFPTCDNTIGGAFRGDLKGVTDKSIIFRRTLSPTVISEGPIGGPYNIPSIPSTLEVTPNSFDEGFYYGLTTSVSPAGNTVTKFKKDGSDSGTGGEEIGFVSKVFSQSIFTELAVSDGTVLIIAKGFSSGPDVFNPPRFAIIDKDGGVLIDGDIPLQELLGPEEDSDVNKHRHWVSPRWAFQGDSYVGLYLETSRKPEEVSGEGRIFSIASAIIRITPLGVITIEDIIICTESIQFVGTANMRSAHGAWQGNSENLGNFTGIRDGIQAGIDSGIFFTKSQGCLVQENTITETLISTMFLDDVESFILGTGEDYKDDLIAGVGGSHDNVQNWRNKGGGVTPEITAINFITANRIEDTATLDKVTISFEMKSGVFRVNLQKSEDGIVWFTDSTVENDGQILVNDEIGGIDETEDVFIRTFSETGQGNIISDSVFLLRLIPIDPPEDLILTPAINSIDVTFDAPVSPNPVITFFEWRIRQTLPTLEPFSAFTSIGLSTAFTAGGLTTGNTYEIEVASSNTKGRGERADDTAIPI